jgi:hypothetical protein
VTTLKLQLTGVPSILHGKEHGQMKRA